MNVRAKFKCMDVQPANDGEGGVVRMEPVTSGSEENEKFYKYTPGGSLVLSTINQAAFAEFSVGGEYFVNITKVTEETASD